MNWRDKQGENKVAAAAAAVARRHYREAQAGGNGASDWVSLYQRRPEHHQPILTCSDPYWGFNPPVQMARFVQPSRLMGTPLGIELVTKFPQEFSKEGLDEFDGAFIDPDHQSVTVHSDPWFPDFWMSLPKTPWDLGIIKPFDPNNGG